MDDNTREKASTMITAVLQREKKAAGIWESAEKDPLTYGLAGAGIGAGLGGAGAGLLSWVRDNKDELILTDALAGAGLGGIAGGALGALPSLIGSAQESAAATPPVALEDRPTPMEAIVGGASDLINSTELGVDISGWNTLPGASVGLGAGHMLNKLLQQRDIRTGAGKARGEMLTGVADEKSRANIRGG
ncbi:MAG TPA: hypothetical protein ENH11_01375, partial [Candidatus Acetothermia bacterium]|nr:hypothetical protein [Candidatus Acetothermia bacterium]